MRANQTRYIQIERLIKKNRHLSAHMALAVDARTIKAARNQVSVADIPILVLILGDKNYGVALAASGLLVTLGERASKTDPDRGQKREEFTRSDPCAGCTTAPGQLCRRENSEHG